MAMLAAIYLALSIGACSTGPSEAYKAYMRTPQGLAEWQRKDTMLDQQVGIAAQRYQREGSIQVLRKYETVLRSYLDHGFALYRAYRTANREVPLDDLIPSLHQRQARLMDVADEYIRQGGTRLAEGIAADLVHEYADLPETSRARQRAEALLFRYRYSRE